MVQVFIDGQEGTTGLQIRERLVERDDLALIEIDPALRKDPDARLSCMARADVTILCLPDAAAIEAVALGEKTTTRFIDASTAHRTDPAWVYGLPELGASQREAIHRATRVANPGCHATGFVTLAQPLLAEGVVRVDHAFAVTSITGYSGGGKKLIERYRTGDPVRLAPPRPYALSLHHKHLPEMTAVVGLTHPPLFMPVLGPFYQGMLVSVALEARSCERALDVGQLVALYRRYYQGERFVRVIEGNASDLLEEGCLSPLDCNGTNRLEIFVFGHERQAVVVARFDNLGKGASGAAVQNLNLMLGVDEDRGLVS